MDEDKVIRKISEDFVELKGLPLLIFKLKVFDSLKEAYKKYQTSNKQKDFDNFIEVCERWLK